MKESLNKADEVKFVAATLMFTSVAILDTIDVLTLGSGKAATTPIKITLKEVFENPTIRKNVMGVIKNNIDELAKYYPEMAKLKKSSFYRKIDSYLDDMFNMVMTDLKNFQKLKNMSLIH